MASELQEYVRDIPDFPKLGIRFKDITPLLGNAAAFAATVTQLADAVRDAAPEYIVGIEARGFIVGAAVAHALGVGFVPVRKPGKLPARTERVTYDLEYGSGTLEVHTDALMPGARVAIVDDLLATGGTAGAAATLVERLGAVVVAHAFVVELAALNGRTHLREDIPVHALLTY